MGFLCPVCGSTNLAVLTTAKFEVLQSEYDDPELANTPIEESPWDSDTTMECQACGEYGPTASFDVINATAHDASLTAEQLDDKYNPEGDGEHPRITRQMWVEAVALRDTISGYWDWVHHKLTEGS